MRITQRRPQWAALNRRIEACRECARLVEWCQTVAREKRAAYREWDYWGGPVANFGDPAARLTLDEGIVYQAGAAARPEAAAVLEVKHAEERLPAWCRAVLGPASPAEYSKFRVLALLALAEASAA